MELDLFVRPFAPPLDFVVGQPFFASPFFFRWERDPRLAITVKLADDDDLLHGGKFRENLVQLWIDLVLFAAVRVCIGREEYFGLDLFATTRR